MINYEEIDELCVPMVKFFNSVGLTTEFSCQGHDFHKWNEFYIMFDESVTDEMVYNFIKHHSNDYPHTPFIGKFMKWIRKCDGEIVSNWQYSISYGNFRENQKYAKEDLKRTMFR